MAHHIQHLHQHLRLRSCAAAAALLCMALQAAPAAAQGASAGDSTSSSQVTVTGRTLSTPTSLSGFDLPAREQPLSLTGISAADIAARGARRLADLTAFDSSVSDAYNAGGYIDYLTVRGFVIDNRYNIRREGLPIIGDTAIALDNKAAVEILKGTSGIQAGTSAPGGLVNYVVKRPTAGDTSLARLEWSSRNSLLAAVDLSRRSAGDGRFAWRLNAAAEHLRPQVQPLEGQRRMVSLATEWRAAPGTLLEAEVEWSHRSQPTQSGFSLLGNTLPRPSTPTLNLNNQPWSLPSVFDGTTGSLRWQQQLARDWRLTVQAGRQQLRTDDRIAFAYGFYDPATFDCNPCDRYTSDGRFSVWDFRSENERRRTDAASATLNGRFNTAGLRHELQLSVLGSRQTLDFQDQAFNLVGIGNVQGTAVLPSDPTLTDTNTNRRESSRELALQDAIRLTPALTAWLGVRHTSLERSSVRTNGSRPTAYSATITTPWVALSARLPGGVLAFASHGEGAETQVVPNRPSQYTNAGQALPVLASRQTEVGLRGGSASLQQPGGGTQWQFTLFDIDRPASNLDACANLGIRPCTGRLDGSNRHRGLEAGLRHAQGAFTGGVSATWLDAERRGSTQQPEINGLRPTNVPTHALRADAAWRLNLRGAPVLQAFFQHEGPREILPDNSLRLPAWSRLDVALRHDVRLGALDGRLSLGVDNVLDGHYWRESPYQFGHAYLYPGAVRTWRAAWTVLF